MAAADHEPMAAALNIDLRGRLALALLFAIAMALAAAAQSAGPPSPHRLTGATGSIELMTAAMRLEDPSGEMSAQDVAAAADRGEMRPMSEAGTRDFGVSKKRALWFRFDVSADEPRDWILDVSRNSLVRVKWAIRSPAGEWTTLPELGDSVPFSARPIPHRNFLFPVRLATGTSTLMLRVQTDGISEIRAMLWQPQALQAADLQFFSFLWLVFGAMATMFVYNLILYLMVRDRGYLLYVAMIALGIPGFVALSGSDTQYLPGDGVGWAFRTLGMSFGLSSYFRIELARHLLSTRVRLPWADKVMVAFQWACLATFVTAIFAPLYVMSPIFVLVGVGSSVFLDVVAIIALIRRWPGAPYYFASWLVLGIGVLIAVVRVLGGIPTNIVTVNIVSLSAAVSYILLSIALAHQINVEKKLREEAQAHTLAILQASQALGSESRLGQLHSKLRDIMRSLTGASRVHLVLWDPDLKGWFVLEGEAGDRRVPLGEVAEQGQVPASVVHHLESTRTPLMLADAMRDERFRADPAFSGAAHCSLLALPIVQHDAMRAVLLLENRSARRLFSASDIAALQSIAGPLAVSVENAMLYERLEQRVAEQTRELRETQQKLLTTARRAGMAEIATNVLHNMGNILNSVNVEADLLRSRLHESKRTGVSRAATLLEAHANDSDGFLGSEKGRLLPGYLRELGETLEGEREEMLERVSRLAASVEHIKNVVATQQAFAGSSVFTERLRPGEIVEETLRITGDSLNRHQIKVVKEVEDIQPVLLDKTRALQILVNLVTNARQALNDVIDRPRALHIRLNADEKNLRFVVRDEGCGIAPENLASIFSHGFTTRHDGHGFGLHSSALAAGEMGGKLTVQSEGLGRGATFTLELPLTRA